MRFTIKLLFVVAVLIVLGVGLLPPVFAKGSLDSDAVAAARAASSASGAAAGAEAAARQSIVGKPGVTLVSVKVNPGGASYTVEVTLAETVHTFMDGLPGMEGWFHITSTQESTFGQ